MPERPLIYLKLKYMNFESKIFHHPTENSQSAHLHCYVLFLTTK